MLVQNWVTLFQDTQFLMENACSKFGDFISSNIIFNGKCLFKIRWLYLKTPNFLGKMLFINSVSLFQETEFLMENACSKFGDFI
jgi:hypothetical protein